MTLEQKADSLTLDERIALLQSKVELDAKVVKLQQQLDWFQRQLFGRKSEQRLPDEIPGQLSLFDQPGVNDLTIEHQATIETAIKGYSRKTHKGAPAARLGSEHFKFSDATLVREHYILPPEVAHLSSDQYDIIDERTTHKLAQTRSQFVVIKEIRPVVKIKGQDALCRAVASDTVFGRSFLDVSVVAGLITDKFQYHLPLYRQHQRLASAGIKTSRGTLSYAVNNAVKLLTPIYDALRRSVLSSMMLAIDETPIKAGKGKPGKLKSGYLWPFYGDQHEVLFHFAPSRATQVLTDVLGTFTGTILSDGYGVYDRFVAKCNEQETRCQHAQCWAHIRRKFDEALTYDKDRCTAALALIGSLYDKERNVKDKQWNEARLLRYRSEHCKPIVDAFFCYLMQLKNQADRLPDDKVMMAINYALRRESQSRTFLENGAVPLDNNHVERQIRPVALGRKNWLFCWTEVGARELAIIQSLISTCKLYDIDPYTYFVDVLQRVSEHPDAAVDDLIPRRWKALFADHPISSPYEDLFYAVN